MKDTIRANEIQFELQPLPANREDLKRAEAELGKWVKLEEEFQQ